MPEDKAPLPPPVAVGEFAYYAASDATVTPIVNVYEINLHDIVIPTDMRPVDLAVVEQIAASILEIGFQPQGAISVEWLPLGSDRRAMLVAGRHRLEAVRRLGWPVVPATVFDGTAEEAQLWRISENLDRSELTVMQRAEAIALRMRLRAEKAAQSGQVSSPAGGRGHRGGIADMARELGTARANVQRAIKIAGLSAEAKVVAERLGLADHQTALNMAAAAGGPDEQVAFLQQWARRHKPPLTPEQKERARTKARARDLRAAQEITDWADVAARFALERFGKNDAALWLEMIGKISPPLSELAPIFVIDRLRDLLRE